MFSLTSYDEQTFYQTFLKFVRLQEAVTEITMQTRSVYIELNQE